MIFFPGSKNPAGRPARMPGIVARNDLFTVMVAGKVEQGMHFRYLLYCFTTLMV